MGPPPGADENNICIHRAVAFGPLPFLAVPVRHITALVGSCVAIIARLMSVAIRSRPTKADNNSNPNYPPNFVSPGCLSSIAPPWHLGISHVLFNPTERCRAAARGPRELVPGPDAQPRSAPGGSALFRQSRRALPPIPRREDRGARAQCSPASLSIAEKPPLVRDALRAARCA